MNFDTTFTNSIAFWVCRAASDIYGNFFLIFLFCKVSNSKFNTLRSLAFSAFMASVSIAVQQIIPQYAYTFFFILMFVSSCYFILKFSIMNSLFVYFLQGIIYCITCAVFVGTLNILNFNNKVILNLFQCILFYIFFNIIFTLTTLPVIQIIKMSKKRFKDTSILNFNKKAYIFINIILFAITLYYYTTVFLQLNVNHIANVQTTIFIISIIICYLFLTAVAFIIYLKYDKKNVELEYQRIYSRLVEQRIINLNNLKNSFDGLLEFYLKKLEEKDYKSLKDELDQQIAIRSDNYFRNHLSIQQIKHPAILGLVTQKLELGHSYGIQVTFNCSGTINEPKNINIMDFCEILGILLDNAIEAAVESAEKRLDILFYYDENELRLSISNTYKVSPDISRIFDNGWSTKGENRGLGLHIARNIINKYQNILINCSVKADRFLQDLIVL